MTEYSFYVIKCKNPDVRDCYVGKTKDLAARTSCHKCCVGRSPVKVYNFIHENGGWDNWTLNLLETRSVEDVKAATDREKYWYDLFQPTLNSNVPGRSRSESQKNWRENNKEYMAAYMAEYMPKYLETRKEPVACCCGGKYSYFNRTHHERSLKHKNFTEKRTLRL